MAAHDAPGTPRRRWRALELAEVVAWLGVLAVLLRIASGGSGAPASVGYALSHLPLLALVGLVTSVALATHALVVRRRGGDTAKAALLGGPVIALLGGILVRADHASGILLVPLGLLLALLGAVHAWARGRRPRSSGRGVSAS